MRHLIVFALLIAFAHLSQAAEVEKVKIGFASVGLFKVLDISENNGSKRLEVLGDSLECRRMSSDVLPIQCTLEVHRPKIQLYLNNKFKSANLYGPLAFELFKKIKTTIVKDEFGRNQKVLDTIICTQVIRPSEPLRVACHLDKLP